MEEEEIEHVVDHRIGSLNGKWSILFRASIGVFVIGIPFIVAFNTWLVISLNEVSTNQKLIAQQLEYLSKNSGEGYSKAEVDLAMISLERKILDKVAQEYPPKWLQQMVESHSIRLTSLEMKD